MSAIVLATAWLTGIYAGSLFRAPLVAVLLTATLFGGLALIWWPRRSARLGALFALVVLLGIARSVSHVEATATNALPVDLDGSDVRIVGTVASEPEERDRYTNITLELSRIRLDEWEATTGKILVRLPRFPEFRYGDVLDLTGVLRRPTSVGDFDYRAYLARRGVLWEMDFPRAKKIGSEEGPPVLAWIFGVREALSDVLDRSLPEPQASLVTGVFLGIRTTIPDDLLEAFSRTNTYHILAISGMNISLVCGLLGAFGRRLWNRRFNVAFLVAGIVAYASLVGPQPSVVRASIMGGLIVIANAIGRPADTIVALLVSAGLMVAHDPALLMDVGFQLSFAATAGLATVVPVIQPHLARLPRFLADSLSVTFAAQIATLPITAMNFGQLSLMTPLANLLVTPAVLPIMVGGAFTAGLGLLFEPAGQVLGWATWLASTYMIVVVEFLGGVSWASLPLGKFGVLPLVPYYGVLALFLVGTGNRALGLGTRWLSLPMRIPTKWSLGALAIAAAVVWAGALTVPGGPTTVSFLDVGQGDAILIQTASGRRVLVDGGPSPSGIANTLGRRLPFWDRTIDLVVLTHANEDHLAGLIEVIERHDVRLVLEPAIPQESASYARFLEAIRKKNVRSVAASAGQEVSLDDETRLRVLHPHGRPREGSKVDLNEYSIVLRLTMGDASVLLTGDAGPEAEREMLSAGENLASTILKVPHHGGAGSLDPAFVAAVQPQAAVITVGANNRFGHPSPDTLRKLEDVRVYRTDLDGTVEVGLEGGGYWVKAGRTRVN